MSDDVFGNLRDWGSVIDRIEAMEKQRTLDHHQQGLARILRYRDNWRLRETVLKCIKHIRRPSGELLQALLAIMMDESIYHEARLMAAEALASAVVLQDGKTKLEDAVTVASVMEKMTALLKAPDVPVFHQGLARLRASLAKPTFQRKSVKRGHSLRMSRRCA